MKTIVDYQVKVLADILAERIKRTWVCLVNKECLYPILFK